MMEKTTRISLNSTMNSAIGPNLTVSLHINKNLYDIPLNNLFSIAARKNKKRDFLFVSKVLGKHVPIQPIALKIIGALLCRLWAEERDGYSDPSTNVLIEALDRFQAADIFQHENFNSKEIGPEYIARINSIINTPLKLKHNTLFIGFAETATGIAQAVFSSSSNSYYIHTTREDIESIKQSIFFFEEHSHATDHALYPLNPNIFNEVEDIVLIDDELTTGKTALNLIEHLPDGKRFGIISILDWRDRTWLEAFESHPKDITVCSLLKGNIECEKNSELVFEDSVVEYTSATSINHKDICFKEPNLIEGYIEYTGRFGLSSDKIAYVNQKAKELASDLKKQRIDENCLCLGTGEFIYVPCLISSELGEKVFFHSTTRSPIYAKNIPGYPIRNKVTFPSPEDRSISNYLYNIPMNFYKQVFIFSEKPLNETAKENFKAIFAHFNIKDIIFVFWN